MKRFLKRERFLLGIKQSYNSESLKYNLYVERAFIKYE